MDPDASAERLKESTSKLHATVQWFTEPPLSLRSWGVRILIAALAFLLVASLLLLAAVRQLQNDLDRDRGVRTDRTCLILTKLDATTAEKREAGCP